MKPIPLAHHRPILLLLFLFLLASSGEAGWVPIGPFGGDVRSLAADPGDPERMYLGTRTGQIYLTVDGGKLWSRLIGLHAPPDWAVDSLAIDPAAPGVLYAGMWSISDGGGGVYKTTDGGLSWKELEGVKGQSIRSLALASSSPEVLVAGSLAGVFRSEDGGASWRRISPAGHREIRNVESVAIDPNHSEIIYIGTWHLPWKTVDGGAHWTSINKGMVDDSDVFSLVVDPSHTQTVYATACSGIYRSDTAGEAWRKINGIPYSSRRTRSLALDPRDPSIVYAGTTEGLWQSKDGGQSWLRLTDHAWVINAILIHHGDSRHFYLGMDGSGVMESKDGGANFQAANRGFAQRVVSRIVPDPALRDRFYATLVQDGDSGGVLLTEDGGANWRPASSGLERRDVSSLLVVTEPGRMLAGTDDGIFEYSAEQPVWLSKSRLKMSPQSSYVPARGISVWDLYRRDAHEPIYAATSAGLLESSDGRTWSRLPLILSPSNVFAVTTGGQEGKIILAATAAGLKISRDRGQSWETILLDGTGQVWVQKIASHPARPDVFFAGANAGLFRSTDGGATWEKFGHGMPFSAIRGLMVAPDNPAHIIVAGSAGIFQSFDGGAHYGRLDDGAGIEGLPIQSLALQPSGSFSILAASAYNGLFFFDGAESGPATAAEQTR